MTTAATLLWTLLGGLPDFIQRPEMAITISTDFGRI